MNEQLAWYVTRASGIVALFLLTMAVAWGLLFGTRLLQGRPSPKWLLDLHRFLGGLAVAFTGIHVAALVADDYVAFGPVDLLVPFAAEWRPGPVAWGIAAMYLLVAVEVTSLAMQRLPRRLWRLVHLSSYALFWTAIVHGATAGTDAAHPAYLGAVTSGIATVAVLSGYRVVTIRRRAAARQRRAAPSSPVVAGS